MAQVTSPILLDSTGQSIVTKLDDIKTAIQNQSGGGGGSSVDFDDVGTASATTTRYQRLTIGNNSYEIRGTKYMEQTVTTSTTSPTTVTFTNADITTSSVIDVMTSLADLTFETVTISSGVCTINIPRQDSAQSCIVRIYIK